MRAAPALLALFALLMLLPPGVSAQYMYLDSNGDGVNTAEDRLQTNGATHVTVWLDTDHDRNGNATPCNSYTGRPHTTNALDFFSYELMIEVGNGAGNTVSYSSFADSMGFAFAYEKKNATGLNPFWTLIATSKPAGRYKLGSFDLTIVSGSPTLVLAPSDASFYPEGYTGFGTFCEASDAANTYILGIDWFDSDGLGAPSSVRTLEARAFTTNSNDVFRLQSNKPTLCVQIEPVGSSYGNADVDLNSLTMMSAGTGSVDQIPALASKTSPSEDRDRNGVPEITACFGRIDLENLFSRIDGRKDLTVTLSGHLMSGEILRGSMTLSVVGKKPSLSASVSPNPLNPDAVLRFETKRPGPLRVRVFDAGGRMIRELVNEQFAPAGDHAIRLDGRAASGEPIASGVYLYQIEAGDETTTGRFALLK